MRILIILMGLVLVALVALIIAFVFVLTPADRRLLLTQPKRISVDGRTRNYRLLGGSTDESRPLVIGLHGYRDRSWWMGAYSGLHMLPDQDITVALPSGVHRSWNGVFCCGYGWYRQVDDVAFIRQMITDIQRNYQIDVSRIYVVGFSNGGALVQKLLAEAPELFAAGAAVMSGIGDGDGNAVDISSATAPLLLINGSDDSYIPLDKPRSSRGFQFVPAYHTAAEWATHYRLMGRQRTKLADYTEFTWSNDTNQQLVQRIYPTSHRWPQWRLWSLPDEIPSSTQEVWKFLNQHQL